MKKILIVGGAGFVGGNLSTFFAEQGNEIIAFDNLVRRGSEFNLERFRQYKNIKFVHGDARNKEDFDNLNFKPDIVLDCSSQPTATEGYKNFRYDMTNNAFSVLNILEYCREKDAGLIYWSTNKVYGGNTCNSIPVRETDTRLVWNKYSAFSKEGWSDLGFSEKLSIDGKDHTPYGVSKLSGDLMVQEFSNAFNVPAVINRFSCLYGTHQWGHVAQGWIAHFVISKILGKPLNIYGFKGKQVRDCLYMLDLCDLIQKQIQLIHSFRGDVYNVGGGIKNTTSVLELNQKLDEILGTKSEITFHDNPRREDQNIYISDITKVQNELRWNPRYNIENGLYDLIQWVKDNKFILEKIV